MLFNGSPRPTLGVEWEIALVDNGSLDLVNSAAEVMDGITELVGSESPRVTKELLRNTVELVTGVCENVGEAMDDL
ncbi:glutamate-cysteine ligase family protein, partial [Rhodococcus sp. EPR-157]|uniref:glutamate-cysteine ligase family protein n=1 Tax=Rhodococcus sp. EPR-157 TaxID=1813677 RepID=UPI001E62888B